MKNATFYVMETDSPSDELSAIEALVCDLAETRWRAGKRILIACEDEQQAIRLDEALWQRPANAFVRRGSSPRDLLISLLPQFADFATAFHEVIDFVPYEESQKQLARDRYKAYRSVGFQLNTATPPQPQTT